MTLLLSFLSSLMPCLHLGPATSSTFLSLLLGAILLCDLWDLPNNLMMVASTCSVPWWVLASLLAFTLASTGSPISALRCFSSSLLCARISSLSSLFCFLSSRFLDLISPLDHVTFPRPLDHITFLLVFLLVFLNLGGRSGRSGPAGRSGPNSSPLGICKYYFNELN